MAQLSDFQRQVIVLFKNENPSWGLTKCKEILPDFFGQITRHQFSTVVSSLKHYGPAVAKTRKPGSGSTTKIDSPTRRAVLELSLSPTDRSQRQISQEVGISKWSVYQIQKEAGLKCSRQFLSEANEEDNKTKDEASQHFESGKLKLKSILFPGKASFSTQLPLYQENDCIDAAVTYNNSSKYFQPSLGNQEDEDQTGVPSSARKRKNTDVAKTEDQKQGKKDIPPIATTCSSDSNSCDKPVSESLQKTATGNEAISSPKPLNIRLSQTFFDVPGIDLARRLLGQTLVRMVGSQRISGRIVETEAYLGLEDKAAHSYQGKKTDRNKAMFMQPGTSYVYNIYGIYCCLNISSQGDGCAVLLRALEPLEGIDLMRETRGQISTKKQKDKEMTNGPSKLCQALQISKAEFNQIDLTSSPTLWLEEGDNIPHDDIIECARINIGYAEEWIDKPLRFYILGNECVSTRSREAELAKSQQALGC